MKTLKCLFLFWVVLNHFLAAQVQETSILFYPDEKWWGGFVAMGSNMPFQANNRWFDLGAENMNNQNVPLLISSKGRLVWSDNPFSFQVEKNKINIRSLNKITSHQAGKTLREAYLYAFNNYFKPIDRLPDTLFFSLPQYNTWIELMYNQNQSDIEKYAENIIKHGFPQGVFMIDDNWQNYYGNFEFKKDKFPDPTAMTNELHAKGFHVMLWVCPFVSPDSPEFRFLKQKGYLIKDKKTNQPAIINWWNGLSACYDLSNPDASAWFIRQLKDLQVKYGIDGFKFDAGDIIHYQNPDLLFFDQKASAADISSYWAKIGLSFPFNEYRACWKMSGQPLVQRLGDKNYSWGAVRLLIPEMIAAGLLGYAYTCPDMIGGGQFAAFLNIDQTKLDQKLIVRSCQIHALMPMMQFSVAPWRVLDQKHLDLCKRFSYLHHEFSPYILEQARIAASTGEPIVRHMEYMYPNQGFEACSDQFMLGHKYLVAPIVNEFDFRKVKLPEGTWKDDLGKYHKGPTILELDVPLDRLPYFEKIK